MAEPWGAARERPVRLLSKQIFRGSELHRNTDEQIFPSEILTVNLLSRLLKKYSLSTAKMC